MPQVCYLYLPAELKLSICWRISTRDLAHLASTCKDFYALIKQHENRIGQDIAVRETARLDRYLRILDFKDVPFLEAFKRWLGCRGIWPRDLCSHIRIFVLWYQECKGIKEEVPYTGRCVKYTEGLLKLHWNLYYPESLQEKYRCSLGGILDEVIAQIEENDDPEWAWFYSQDHPNQNLDMVKENPDIFGNPTIFDRHLTIIQRAGKQWHFEYPTKFSIWQDRRHWAPNFTRLDLNGFGFPEAWKIDPALLPGAFGVPKLPPYSTYSHFSYCQNGWSVKLDDVLRRAINWCKADEGLEEERELRKRELETFFGGGRVSLMERAFFLENLYIF